MTAEQAQAELPAVNLLDHSGNLHQCLTAGRNMIAAVIYQPQTGQQWFPVSWETVARAVNSGQPVEI